MKTIKNLFTLPLMLAMFVCLLSGCSTAQQSSGNIVSPAKTDKKILIVYLSRTSNTKAVAEMILKNVGGTLIAIELEKSYPENYEATVKQVAKENETGFLPSLKTKIENIEQYDTIFLGFPTWGMQLPPPVKSFLKQYDLKDKTVVPFNTNAGYGEGGSLRTVQELCTGCTVLEGFVTKGGIERDGQFLVIKEARATEVRNEVEVWLKKIKMLP